MRTAVIIGAGPAGLTAAVELCRRTDVRPIVLEMGRQVGGLSQTVNHNGNRIDIGGHRFFSKSDRVMAWWLGMLPLQRLPHKDVALTYHNRRRTLDVRPDGPDPETVEQVMLLRSRRSRIYFRGQLYNYPLTLDGDPRRKLGLHRAARIGVSYLRAAARPRPEHNLEDFLINRFGRELYQTFFLEYTEKVWGRPCHQISAEWGAQRIKGLSLRKALAHFLQRVVPGSPMDIGQKSTETSLIEHFLYPKYGPGQMWEAAADEVTRRGGQIHLKWRVIEVISDENDSRTLRGVIAQNAQGQRRRFSGDVIFSTMPIQELIRALRPTRPAPHDVAAISEGLEYRDFITVGLLLDRLRLIEAGQPIRDNWLYIQEPGVSVGRIQIFNNWSPYLIADPTKTWLGMEYFCNQGDALWSRSDAAMMNLAVAELTRIGIASRTAVRDGVVIRMPRTYPAYFGTYRRFARLRAWLDSIRNLYLVGRNGMHRYNNQDHSMLTAMVAVDNLVSGRADKANIWAVNTEPEYHEERTA